MSKPRLLDLFCGAGGAAVGYHRAGFEIVGVDVKPQPRYPFEFFHEDAMRVLDHLARHQCATTLGYNIHAIHASPPCQRYSAITVVRGVPDDHPDLLEPVRELLETIGLPWVMENVAGAPMAPHAVLCGSMFRLGVRRHRLFESSSALMHPECRHAEQGTPLGVYGHPGGVENSRKDKGKKGSTAEWAAAMGIDWMTAAELAQAIPPPYTEHIGGFLMSEVTRRAKAAA